MCNRIFIENQPYSIFKHDETASYYEERCLPIANEGDIIITSHPIDKAYINYLYSLGVLKNVELLTPKAQERDLASSIINDQCLLKYIQERVREKNWIIETFLYGKSLEELSKIFHLSLHPPIGIYKKYGTKSGFRNLADRLGLPIPHGVVAKRHEIDRILSFSKKCTEVVVKQNNTVGGLSVFMIPNNEGAIRETVRDQKVKCVVEERLGPRKQGSVQIFIENATYKIIIDESIMENTHFRGFKYPLKYEKSTVNRIEYCGGKIANYLLEQKVCNAHCGLDFIISKDGVYFHDLNPRKTGVSYVLCFLFKLFGESKTRKSSVISVHTQLPPQKNYDMGIIIKKLQFLLYNYGLKKEGILLFNPGLLKFNTMHLIAISFDGKEKKYIQQAKETLKGRV